jgi:hypothetical protein
MILRRRFAGWIGVPGMFETGSSYDDAQWAKPAVLNVAIRASASLILRHPIAGRQSTHHSHP